MSAKIQLGLAIHLLLKARRFYQDRISQCLGWICSSVFERNSEDGLIESMYQFGRIPQLGKTAYEFRRLAISGLGAAIS